LAAPSALSFLRLRQGQPGLLHRRPPYPYSDIERDAIHHRQADEVGGPETVRAGLEDLLERTAADELMLSMVYDHLLGAPAFLRAGG